MDPLTFSPSNEKPDIVSLLRHILDPLLLASRGDLCQCYYYPCKIKGLLEQILSLRRKLIPLELLVLVVECVDEDGRKVLGEAVFLKEGNYAIIAFIQRLSQKPK